MDAQLDNMHGVWYERVANAHRRDVDSVLARGRNLRRVSARRVRTVASSLRQLRNAVKGLGESESLFSFLRRMISQIQTLDYTDGIVGNQSV